MERLALPTFQLLTLTLTDGRTMQMRGAEMHGLSPNDERANAPLLHLMLTLTGLLTRGEIITGIALRSRDVGPGNWQRLWTRMRLLACCQVLLCEQRLQPPELVLQWGMTGMDDYRYHTRDADASLTPTPEELEGFRQQFLVQDTLGAWHYPADLPGLLATRLYGDLLPQQPEMPTLPPPRRPVTGFAARRIDLSTLTSMANSHGAPAAHVIATAAGAASAHAGA